MYNDLKAAVEVSLGSIPVASPVLYPGSGCSFALSCRDIQEPKKHPNINFRVGYPNLISLIKEGILGYPNLMAFV